MPQRIGSGDWRHRLFRGWWIVLVCAVGMAFSTGTMVVYTFGVFAKPLASELKTSRGSIALAVSILDIIAQFLIGRGGWHLWYLGCLGRAGACMAVAVPVVSFFLLESPEEVGLLPDGQAPSAAASVQGGW